MTKGLFRVVLLLYCTILQGRICTARSIKTGKVFPVLIEQRSSTGELTLRINEDLVLSLQRASVFSDSLQLSSYDGDAVLIHNLRGRDLEKSLYHDTEQGAAVVVSITDGVRVEGMLGDRLRISPTDVAERNAAGHLAHQIFEVNLRYSEGKDMAPSSLSEPLATANDPQPSNVTAMERARKEIKTTLTPEVHVLIDAALTSKLKNNDGIVKYYSVFFAFVNLKFKTLDEWLDVQLVISKITTYTEGKDTFVTKPPNGRGYMLLSTINNLRSFIEKKKEFENDDLVILLTGLDIADYDSRTGRVHSEGTAGYAFVGGACKPSKVGMVEDNANMFTGAHAFAHEVGHLLGMYHDGDGPRIPVNNSPGARACNPNDGYIMAPSQGADSVHMFSECSAKQLDAFRKDPQSKCLNNRVQRHSKPLSAGVIKGRVVSTQAFCELKHPGKKVRHVESFKGRTASYDLLGCHIICNEEGSNYFNFYDAPDNTPCYPDDPSLVCINRDCVQIPSDLKTFNAYPKRAP